MTVFYKKENMKVISDEIMEDISDENIYVILD